MATESGDEQQPLLRVITQDATAEEIAVLLAVFLASQTPATPGNRISPEWPVTKQLRSSHLLRPPSWRASSLPG